MISTDTVKEVKNFFDAEFKSYSFSIKHSDMVKIEMIPHDFFPEHFLDIGSGGGSMLRAVRARYPECNCYGLDISESMLIQVDKTFNPILSSVTNLPFKKHSFDMIYIGDVLHHIIVGYSRPNSKKKVQEILKTIHSLIKPGGYILISDIYYHGFILNIMAPLIIFYSLRCLNGLPVNGTTGLLSKFAKSQTAGKSIVNFYTSEELANMLNNVGRIKRIHKVKWGYSTFFERFLFKERGEVYFLVLVP